MITAILARLLAIIREASRVFGSSRRFAILFHPESCFVFRRLTSRYVREKNATSAPDMKNERISRTITVKESNTVAWVLATRNKGLNTLQKALNNNLFSKSNSFVIIKAGQWPALVKPLQKYRNDRD